MAREASNVQLKYRWPSLVPFLAAVVGMAVVTDLALATGPNATNWERDVMANGGPAHWQAVKTLTGGLVNLASMQRFYFHLWADYTTGSSAVTFWIAVGAWIIHVVEALFALRKCARYGASTGVTLAYGIGVFLSGIAQFGPLNAEARRVSAKQTQQKQQ